MNGGELNYPSVDYDLDMRGYDRCTMFLLQLSYLANQVYFIFWFYVWDVYIVIHFVDLV